MYKPINTDKGGVIYARASILGIASPVMKNMLKQSKSCGRRKSVSVRGVPHQAVRAFIHLLSSWADEVKSCYRSSQLRFREAYWVVKVEQVEPRPGVLRLMDEAKTAGIKLSVCSPATKSSVIFCLESFIGNGYWVSAIAARPSSTHKGYLLGGLVWFAVPFSLAKSLGVGALALDLPITTSEVDHSPVTDATAILSSSGS